MKKLLSHGTILVGHSLNKDLQGRYILELALLGIFPLVWNTFFYFKKAFCTHDVHMFGKIHSCCDILLILDH